MKASDNPVKWCKMGAVKYCSFIGTNVIVYGTGLCIKFFNITTGEEHMLFANKHSVFGEGVRGVRGHRSVNVFAYAENSRDAVLHVRDYPTFNSIARFTDGPAEGYCTMTFSETSLLVTLGDIPNFVISIWNWRRNQKLGELRSNIRLEHQMLRCSWGKPVNMVQLGMGSEKLYLWDVFICCKSAVLAKHELKFVKEEFNLAAFSDCVWAPDENLYVVDCGGSIYVMTPDLHLDRVLEVQIEGNIDTSISDYKGGIVVSGPNSELRHYVKDEENRWECDWKMSLAVGVRSMFSNRTEFLIAITLEEEIIKITQNQITYIKQKQNLFNDICLIYPTGVHVVAFRQNKFLDVYQVHDGAKIAETELSRKALSIAENPELPYVAVGYDNGTMELMSFYKPEHPTVMTSFDLTRNYIENIKFFEKGRVIVAGCADIGEFFLIEGFPGTHMKVITSVHANCQIVDFMLVASKNCYRLFLIPVTTKFMAGNKIIRYCIMSKTDVNIKEYQLENEEFLYRQLVPTKTSNRDRIFYAVPFNSKNIHILETKRGDPLAKIISEIKTGHQMNHFGLRISKYHALTWGYDGFVFARDNNFEENVGMSINCHRYYGGAQKAYIDPLGKYIILLGRSNNVICTDIVANDIDEERKNYLTELRDSTKFALMFKRPTIGFKPEGKFINKTWLETEKLIEIENEEELCRIEKEEILEEFSDIKSTLLDLVTKNLNGPENEKLDLQEFFLDIGLYNVKKQQNREDCKKAETYLKALIVAQDKVTQHLIKDYWNEMEHISKMVSGFFVNTMVTRYGLLPPNLAHKKRRTWVEEQRKVEQFLSVKGCFIPWTIRPEEEVLEIVRHSPKLPSVDYNNLNVINILLEADPKVYRSLETQLAAFGSVTPLYVETSTAHYVQRQIVSFYQSDLQQAICEGESGKLKNRFNTVFDELMNQKFREMSVIKERNARLRHIISEINYFSENKIDIIIIDPEWKQKELPDMLRKVYDYEMTITPYISPSEQAIIDAKAAEDERIRLALLADDFKERALMAMMNGVLEVRWEDELKKDVPIPKCMIEKEPEQFNEDDLRAVRDYDEKVAFLHSERERYKNLLDAEYTKIATGLRESIRKFNQKVKDCLEFKMHIDSALNQENLKVNRTRWKQNERIKLQKKEEKIKNAIKETESLIEELRNTISSLSEVLNDCRTNTDIYLTKEKLLEKSFKKDIQEMSPVVQEQAAKLYKKRPKTVFRFVITAAVFTELSKCIVGQERSLILTSDCVEYLKAVEQLDLFIGLPPTIDENIHNIICKHRRLRMEFEMRLKAFQIEISEGEATIATFQKRYIRNKEKVARLHNELQQTRTDYLYLIHNLRMQIILRRGLVETPLSGDIKDFADSILIHREEIENINKLIVEAGNKKLQAIMRNMGFRRNIMATEWEHRKLRMQINDLIEQLNDINGVKFTKEMQLFLKAKALGRRVGMESVESELEIIAAAFQNRIKDKKEKLLRVKKQIQSYIEHNNALDLAIQNVNIDVCDLRLQKDDELKEKEKEAVQLRMDALLKRSSLIQQIQQNHNEILVLQTELELLRLKTYPTFKYKLINNN